VDGRVATYRDRDGRTFTGAWCPDRRRLLDMPAEADPVCRARMELELQLRAGRLWGIQTACFVCGAPVEPVKGKGWCSPACRREYHLPQWSGPGRRRGKRKDGTDPYEGLREPGGED
jgi:hypothetical protein